MAGLWETLPSLRSFFKAALLGSQIPFIADPAPMNGPPLGTLRDCPNPSMSCPRDFAVSDTCCINAPGGQFAATQFWNSDAYSGPPGYLGPNNSWTIHGLWPDHCNGRYDSVCDCARSGDCSSRNRKCSSDTCNRDYSSITNILQEFGQDELLSYMGEYWKGIAGNEHLWQHEWSKHGTCVSTLEPKCYDDYESTQEVIHYFQRTVDVFKTLPSFEWLAAAGIVPTKEKTYNLVDIESALKAPRGVSPVIGCQGGELREIWYHYIVRGNLQSGDFVDIEPDFSGTGGPGKSCPDTGIRYLPKETREGPLPTKTGAVPTGTSKPTTKGHLIVKVKDGGERGCLISNGKWFNTVIGSSCASFSPQQSGESITLISRKGPCGIKKGGFRCSVGTSATSFKVVDGNLVTQDGTKEWSAAEIPRGTEQQTVYPSGDEEVGIELHWRT